MYIKPINICDTYGAAIEYITEGIKGAYTVTQSALSLPKDQDTTIGNWLRAAGSILGADSLAVVQRQLRDHPQCGSEVAVASVKMYRVATETQAARGYVIALVKDTAGTQYLAVAFDERKEFDVDLCHSFKEALTYAAPDEGSFEVREVSGEHAPELAHLGEEGLCEIKRVITGGGTATWHAVKSDGVVYAHIYVVYNKVGDVALAISYRRTDI